ncbi:hypothetical protein BD414DRAFT_119740 [Trametes punicea]|nr:hypothetical protein BD414DRAFT_119740 [Trametes punicea]
MSSRTLTKACPYEGCDYISTSTSSFMNDHKISSHVSNLHAQKTKVWHGATQVYIHRDLKTRELTCHCGEFSHRDASAVRRHASDRHKGSAGSELAGGSILAFPNLAISPPPSKATGSDLVPSRSTSHNTVKQKLSAVSKHQISSHSLEARSAGLKRAREVPLDSGPSDGAVPPSKARKKGLTTLPSSWIAAGFKLTSKAAVPSASISANVHLANDALPISTWQSRISANPVVPPLPGSHRKREGLPTLSYQDGRAKAAVRPSDNHSASTRAVPEAQALSQFTIPGKKSKTAPASSVSSPSIARTTPMDSPAVVDRRGVLPISRGVRELSSDRDGEHAQDYILYPSNWLDEGVLECNSCSITIKCQHDDIRILDGWTCSACRLKQSTRARTAGRTRAPLASVSRPAAASRHRPRPVMSPFKLDPSPNQSLVFGPVSSSEKMIASTSERSSLPSTRESGQAHRPSDPFSAPASGLSGWHDHLELSASDTETDPGPLSLGAGDSQPAIPHVEPAARTSRRKRVSKQMRARAFRRWFNSVLDDYHAQKTEGTTSSPREAECVRYLRSAGGTAYTTADEFFEALQACRAAHQQRLKQGKKGVMEFFGGYSIVAQPRIGHGARAEKVKARLRELGMN